MQRPRFLRKAKIHCCNPDIRRGSVALMTSYGYRRPALTRISSGTLKAFSGNTTKSPTDKQRPRFLTKAKNCIKNLKKKCKAVQ